MKIYTKTGDDGTTGLYGGDRTPKISARIEAIGEVDELNALLGVARAQGESSFDDLLETTQSRLFDLGAELASPPGGKFDAARIRESHVEALEQSMDEMTDRLPPLREFILPGGHLQAAALHHARAVCRRTERAVLRLHEQEPVREVTRRYLNRLSDWLFVAARTVNADRNVSDVKWHASQE